MKKVFALFSFAIVSMTFYYGCSNSGQGSKKEGFSKWDRNYHKKSFDSLMIADKAIQLDFYGELLADKGFTDIYEHSSFYKNDCVAFLSNDHFTDTQAMIGLCAMQKLSLNDYIKLCNLFLSLFDQNKVTEYTLEYAITSPPHFPHNRLSMTTAATLLL